jgi:hypothetical protein
MWTKRDELIRCKKCALHVSPFEPAVSADELLLHAGVANTSDEKCRDYEHASHTPNEKKMSHRANYEWRSRSKKIYA